MNGREPRDPERLRLTAAPGSALASGLSAARLREPSEAHLRALEANLAGSLGAAAMGAAAGATLGGIAGAPAGARALLSTAHLKATAALFALVAGTSGVVAYRQAHHAPPAVVAAAPLRAHPTEARPRIGSPVAPPAAPAPAVAPPVVDAKHVDAVAPGRVASSPDALIVIARAQRLLVSDPAAALALVEEDRRMLAQSPFAQEAEVIAVGAMVRLGRTEEARDRALRFVARFPGSVHAARMRRVSEIIK